MLFSMILIQSALGSVSVFNPQSLKDQFPVGIASSLGNFGNPPYGTSIIGNLLYFEATKACNPIFETNPLLENQNVILMVDRGDCSFAIKVKHAQDWGAKSVIVVNNVANQNVDKIIMKDNGLGGNLFIPAFLISQEDGLIIKESLIVSEAISLVLNFEMPTLPGHVYLNLWMSSGNLPSLTFLQEFSSIGTQLTKKNSEFTPHYVAIKCLACEENNFEIEHDDCLGGGRYCAPDPDGPGPVSGRMVVQENLRQMCMFEQLENDSDYSRWFLFQKDFATTCISNKFNKECSIELMKDYNFDTEKVENCYKKSFIKGFEDSLGQNTALDLEFEIWKGNGLHFYPALIINGQLYRGDMENSAVLSGICSGYQIKYKPEFCFANSGSILEGFSKLAVFTILFIFFLAVFGILLIYRHFAKKKLERDINKQVNLAVSQYYALSDISYIKNKNRPPEADSFN